MAKNRINGMLTTKALNRLKGLKTDEITQSQVVENLIMGTQDDLADIKEDLLSLISPVRKDTTRDRRDITRLALTFTGKLSEESYKDIEERFYPKLDAETKEKIDRVVDILLS